MKKVRKNVLNVYRAYIERSPNREEIKPQNEVMPLPLSGYAFAENNIPAKNTETEPQNEVLPLPLTGYSFEEDELNVSAENTEIEALPVFTF